MKKLIKNVLFDLVLWGLIYFTIIQGNSYAESALDFIIVCVSFFAILIFTFVSKEMVLETAKKKDQTCKLHRSYSNISTFFEVLVFASQGWYFLASFWVVSALIGAWARSVYDEKLGEPDFI